MGVRGFGVALAVVVALALPAASVAQDDCATPTGDQYCPPVEVITEAGGGDPSDPSAEGSGGLPFTGLDLGLSLVVGAGLLGAGLLLRRARGSGGTS